MEDTSSYKMAIAELPMMELQHVGDAARQLVDVMCAQQKHTHWIITVSKVLHSMDIIVIHPDTKFNQFS